MKLFVFTLFMPLALPSYAGVITISAMSTTSQKIERNNFTSVYGYQAVSCTSDSETYADVILTNPRKKDTQTRTISCTGDPVALQNRSSSMNYTITVYNTHPHINRVTIYAGTIGSDAPWPVATSLNLSPAPQCSTSISEPDIPSMFAGSSTTSSMTVVTTGTQSSLFFTGKDITSSGTLNLNGSPAFTITPGSTFVIPGAGAWAIPGPSRATIPLTVTVTADALAKQYTSTLTATLSCE